MEEPLADFETARYRARTLGRRTAEAWAARLRDGQREGVDEFMEEPSNAWAQASGR